jgi:hypothetical protein
MRTDFAENHAALSMLAPGPSIKRFVKLRQVSGLARESDKRSVVPETQLKSRWAIAAFCISFLFNLPVAV